MLQDSFLKAYIDSAENLKDWDWKSLSGQQGGYSVKSLEALRISAFKLQSLGRILRKSAKKNKDWTDWALRLRDDAKFIEDCIGGVL